MINNYNVLALIPARGGSKGVKNKNLIKIGGYSLVERALFTAMGVNSIDRIIVTSDSDEIIKLVNRYGEYAPFKRPGELATDEAGSLEVIQHGLKWAEEMDRETYNYIVLVEPPCPFRLPSHLEDALKMAVEKEASSVVSLVEVRDYHPIRMKKMDKDGALKGFCMEEPNGLRRQDQEPAFIRNCAVYVFSRETISAGLLWGNAPYGYLMERSLYATNIDEPIDILTARSFFKEMRDKRDKLEMIEYIADSSGSFLLNA